MKKTFILAALFIVLLYGCGNASDKAIDFTDFSSDILENGVFSEQLFELDEEIGYAQYGISPSDCMQSRFFFSSGATAEELVLFEAADSNAVARIKDAVKERVSLQRESFKSYVPSEVPKLDDCLIFTRDNYVFLIVADNYNAAKSIISNY